jgi:hypothetical protein
MSGRAAERRNDNDSAQPLRIDDSDLLLITFNGAAAGTVTSLLFGHPDISNRNPSGSFRALLPCTGDESFLCS